MHSARPLGDPIGDAASYVTARIAIENPAASVADTRKAVEDFTARSKPRNPLVAELLGLLADHKFESKGERRQLYFQALAEFPNSSQAQTAKRRIEQLDEERFLSLIDPAKPPPIRTSARDLSSLSRTPSAERSFRAKRCGAMSW